MNKNKTTHRTHAAPSQGSAQDAANSENFWTERFACVHECVGLLADHLVARAISARRERSPLQLGR